MAALQFYSHVLQDCYKKLLECPTWTWTCMENYMENKKQSVADNDRVFLSLIILAMHRIHHHMTSRKENEIPWKIVESAADSQRVKDSNSVQHSTTLASLLSLPIIKQRGAAWFLARNQVIATASEILPFLNKKTMETDKLIKRKALHFAPRTPHSATKHCLTDQTNIAPLRFGVQFEPIAQQLFEILTGQKVYELGLVLHPDFPRLLGASPDGVYVDKDENVCSLEIKCRYNKELNGKPTEANIHQMQAQMSVLKVNKVSFFDCYFSRLCSSDYMNNECECTDKKYNCKGIFIRHPSSNGDTADTYIYPEKIKDMKTKEDFSNWHFEHKLTCNVEDCTILYYHVDSLFHTVYDKDPTWEAIVFPNLEIAALAVAEHAHTCD